MKAINKLEEIKSKKVYLHKNTWYEVEKIDSFIVNVWKVNCYDKEEVLGDSLYLGCGDHYHYLFEKNDLYVIAKDININLAKEKTIEDVYSNEFKGELIDDFKRIRREVHEDYEIFNYYTYVLLMGAKGDQQGNIACFKRFDGLNWSGNGEQNYTERCIIEEVWNIDAKIRKELGI